MIRMFNEYSNDKENELVKVKQPLRHVETKPELVTSLIN